MKEEDVTKIVLDWLEDNGWEVVCYDFPQSGTGILLHGNNSNRTEKNKGGIIPDIIAVKNNDALFFENKDRYYKPDFDKLRSIKIANNYSDSLEILLSKYKVNKIHYGIGIPNIAKEITKCQTNLHLLDFLIGVNSDKSIVTHHDPGNVLILMNTPSKPKI